MALALQKVVASRSISPSIVNIADMEARTGCRYRRGKAWLCREAKVDNGNTWETLDAERRFCPFTIPEGRKRQRNKEGDTNADEEGDERTQRRFPGEHDGELIAGVLSTKSTRRGDPVS